MSFTVLKKSGPLSFNFKMSKHKQNTGQLQHFVLVIGHISNFMEFVASEAEGVAINYIKIDIDQ